MRELAVCAENKGYSMMADGFWDKAYELHKSPRKARKKRVVGLPVSPRTTPASLPGMGFCPECGGQLRVVVGIDDWCSECMDMVMATLLGITSRETL